MSLSNEQRELIEQLYKQMHVVLLSYAKKCLRSSEVSEDVVQITFAIACSKIEDLEKSPNPNGWIFNVLKNVINSIWRIMAKDAKLTESMVLEQNAFYEMCEVLEPFIDSEFEEKSVKIIGRENYDLLCYVHVKGYSEIEAAKKFGLKYDTCKKRIQRAEEKLRKYLK